MSHAPTISAIRTGHSARFAVSRPFGRFGGETRRFVKRT